MKSWWRPGLAVLVLAALLALGWALRPASPASRLKLYCDDLGRGCPLGPGASLRTSAEPSALKPFRLQVSGIADQTLTARFGMSGMDMGPIAFPLARQADGTLAAQVILPFCVQGRRDWRLWLDGEAGRVEVLFTTS
ncbi:hypothetical protein FNU76_06900 [Chitinimonas arctica]|uniref:Uncharacterized protein n=1 Tax=Chitinimonas arctica TaxID=2594795 RepID=A0A516SD66_9NEIS|nr:hypothetical protein [Chitinimonas arctica]QDQ26102.1 hypothetical protein FNU76_06900 [Chitinimonas arctica]